MNHLGRPASRRVVVLGTLAGVSAALAGCGVRLEDGAPNIPFVPTREPIPGESALIALLRDCASLRDLAAGTPGPVASGLVTLHDRQHEVLRDALRARGVPDRLIDGDSSPETSSSAPSPTIPSSAPAPTPADLAAAELTTVTDGAPLRGIARDLVPTVSSLLAQRISAATLLTGAPPTRPVDPAAQSPTGSPTSASPPPAPPALATVLAATRAAAYRLEVSAAQSEGATRRGLLAAISRLDEIAREVVAVLAQQAPAPRLGEPLPYPVTTPAAAAQLAAQTLTELRASLGGALAGLTAHDPTLTLTRMPWWLGEVDALGRAFRVPVAPFPGLA